MQFENEYKLLEIFLIKNNLKQSEKRIQILDVILSNAGHFTVDGLFQLVRKNISGIGQATIYRSVRLFVEAGILKEIKFEDGVSRYEVDCESEHHHHLVCIKCQRLVEIQSKKIELLQESIAKEHGFELVGHSFELFGICSECKDKESI